jgi:hypothetical protein
VSARFLLATFDAVYLIAMTAWIGAMLFFSFGVAPLIFRVLGAEAAAKFVRALFPRYYAWGATAGAVALASFVCGSLSYPEYRGTATAIQSLLLLAGTLAMLYGGNTLTPAVNAARDAGPPGSARFERLHRRGVRLNGLGPGPRPGPAGRLRRPPGPADRRHHRAEPRGESPPIGTEPEGT